MQQSTLRIAWRNLGRNRRRTALAALAIGIGQWALLAEQGLMHGYADNVQNAVTGPMIGHVQIHAPEYRDDRALDLAIGGIAEKLEAIRKEPGVANATPRIYTAALMAPEQEAFVAMVLGVDVHVESEPFGLLSGYADTLKPGHVMIGRRLAQQSGAQVGQEIALVSQAIDGSLANDLYTVQAVIESPADMINQSGVVMGIEDAQRFLAMPDQAHEIVVRAERPDDVDAVLAGVRSLDVLAGLEILPWRELVPELVLIIDMSAYAGYFILVLVLIVAVAGIVNTLMMATYERMHEFGMLLALGCSPGRIVRMIMLEAVLLGAVGVAVGTALGIVFVAVTAQTGIDFTAFGGEEIGDVAFGGMRLPLEIVPRLEAIDALIGLIAVAAVALLASVWPAYAAGRLDPMEAMRA